MIDIPVPHLRAKRKKGWAIPKKKRDGNIAVSRE
jgi:hypothetical protein